MDYVKTDNADVPVTADREGNRPWTEFAQMLKDDPGEWYEVSDHGMTVDAVKVYASRIRRGGLKPFRPFGAFEARCRGQRLWARFLGA